MKILDYPLPRHEARQSRLEQRRALKIARSAHAYVRGSTARFYEWLDGIDTARLPEGPPVWICGDCHVGNLGPVANADGKVEMEVRDLDQTVIGNPAHDLIRLALSLAMAARASDLPGVTAAEMTERLIYGYQAAFAAEAPACEKPECVRTAMKASLRRSWKHVRRERLQKTRPSFPLGRRFWPLSKRESAEVRELFQEDEIRALVTLLRPRDDDSDIELLDAAYWVKGCSSLGRLRLAVLLGVEGLRPEDGGLCLIDVKEAVQAAAPRASRAKMPRENGERVVAGATHLAPFLGERMRAARCLGRSVFLRELLPEDLKIEIGLLSRQEARATAGYLGHIVGQAHARQMDEEMRTRWAGELARSHSKKLDAPSWLWSSLVDLVGVHEAAYLEHCRRYALKAREKD